MPRAEDFSGTSMLKFDVMWIEFNSSCDESPTAVIMTSLGDLSAKLQSVSVMTWILTGMSVSFLRLLCTLQKRRTREASGPLHQAGTREGWPWYGPSTCTQLVKQWRGRRGCVGSWVPTSCGSKCFQQSLVCTSIPYKMDLLCSWNFRTDGPANVQVIYRYIILFTSTSHVYDYRYMC